MNETSSIVVTGASGKVGRRLIEMLSVAGYKNIHGITRSDLDLSDAVEVKKYFHRIAPTHVFMLAAKVGGIQDNLKYPADYLVENLKIQMNIFEALVDVKPQKCIFACSAGAYPIDTPNPKVESMFMSGRTESSNEGYVIAKIVGVKLAELFHKQYGLLTVSPMIANIYGTYDNYDLTKSHVISSLIRKIVTAKELGEPEVCLLGTGEARREFIHVDDVARGLIFLMQNFTLCEIINLGSGYDISIKELATLIAKKIGYQGGFQWDGPRTDGMKQRLCDISKLRSLGFETQIDLEAGLDQTIKEFYALNSSTITT